MNIYKIKDIYSGKEEDIQKRNKSYKTSYKKISIKNKQYVNSLGLTSDTQSDKKNHGGVDKALCVYTQHSYDFFKQEHNIDLPKCALGENITLENCGDINICIADQFSCGDAIFEVSQPRQPCWLISSVLEIKNLTSLIVKEGKTGFYLRVIKEGEISKENSFKLIKRKYENLNIEYINKCYFNAKDHQYEIQEILKCSELATSYRTNLLKRYKNEEVGLESYQNDK